jgi:polyhydroxyalkanoate synthesis repressor PhaR
MSEPRIITKYPNRRLYDNVESRYVALNDVRRLVLEKVPFVVREKKTGADITRAVLLQVIADQEERGEPVMSEDFLAQVIRSYGGTMQGFIGQYLEQSLRLFLQQQQQMNQRMRSMVGYDPGGITQLANLAQDNFQRWKEAQDQLLKGFLDAEKS